MFCTQRPMSVIKHRLNFDQHKSPVAGHYLGFHYKTFHRFINYSCHHFHVHIGFPDLMICLLFHFKPFASPFRNSIVENNEEINVNTQS